MNRPLGLVLAITLTAPVCAQDARDWTLTFDRLGSSNRVERDIDISAVTLSTPLRSTGAFTLSAQAGFLAANGRALSLDRGWVSADALAAFGGLTARMHPAPTAIFNPFVEVGMGGLITDRSLPDHPTLNLFEGRIFFKFDARLGTEVAVTDTLNLEAALVLNHISNGTGLGIQNINFDGAGLSIGLQSRW